MKTSDFMRVYAITFSLFCIQANGQTNGIILELVFPDSPLLGTEENSIHLSVKNGSDHPLPLVTSLQTAIRSQVKIELGYTSERYRTLRYSQSASWDNTVGMADKVLAPGQSYIWEWNSPYNLMVYSDLMNDISGLMVTNISVSLQVGNDQWVSTSPLPITVLTEKESKAIIDNAVPVLETTFRNQFTGQSWPMPLNKLAINGKTYLFTSFGTRVCELPNGEIPAIQNNTDGTGFTLTFPTTKQRVRYNVTKMKVEPDEN